MRRFAQQLWDEVFLLNLFSCSPSEPFDNLKVQKVVFITENEARGERLAAANFPFFRYNLGPYSKELANDVRKLEDFRFIDPETRELTARGKYVVDYVAEEIKESKDALYVLGILHEACAKYANWRSPALVNHVYGMKVPVFAFGYQEMSIRDIPHCTDILDPQREDLKSIQVFSPQLMEDLQAEFSMSPEDLSPENPANIAFAKQVLTRALAD